MITRAFSAAGVSLRVGLLLTGALLISSCSDRPLAGPEEEIPTEDPTPTTRPLGVYEFSVTGIGGSQPAAGKVIAADLTDVVTDLDFELVSINSFVDGERGADGQRYVTLNYRVRNASGAPVTNVTLIPNTTAGTIAGTPWLRLRLFDGSDADPSIAESIVPTGAVALGEDLSLKALYPDVLQVFTEAEISALTLPDGVTGLFPYGFMVRSREAGATSRTIPVAADANDYGGVLTFSFRFPLTAANATDPFSFRFWATAYEDSETRITESIEEAADTAAVRRLRQRAAALNATTTTVLAGSSAMHPAVPDYPGQRQICSVRAAGPAGAPVSEITAPGPYSHLMLLRPGESLDPCAANFRTGAPGRPATNVSFPLEIVAVDRYGNQKVSVTDTVSLERMAGPMSLDLGTPVRMSGGQATMPVTYMEYGTSTIAAVGKRNRGWQVIPVAGVTRTWTGATSTDWHTGSNWGLGAVPMPLDSVVIPPSASNPVLGSNVIVHGVTVEDAATISLGSFDLTAVGNVVTGGTGEITSTTGRLFLSGTARTVAGRLPRLRVSGTYSMVGNVFVRAPFQVDGGRLTSASYRLQIEN